MTTSARIATLLPPREGFSPSHFGAIALCVRDFIQHSEYKDISIVYGGVDHEPFDSIHYHALKAKKSWFQRQSTSYVNALISALCHAPSIQLVEVHNRPHFIPILQKGWNGSVALHLHNDPQEMRGAKTIRQRQWLADNCAAIYCVSQFIKKRFLEGIDDNRNIVHVIYNGLLLPDSSSLPPKKKQILFVGRMKAEKGALEFAQALAETLPNHPDWRGILVGSHRHEPNARITAYERQIINALAPLYDQVETKGFLSHEETIQLYAESAIAVVPSLWDEAFGRTALEAMASGCATISSLRGGLKEVVGSAALPLHEVTAQEISFTLTSLLTNQEKLISLQAASLLQAQKFHITHCTKGLDNLRRGIVD